MRALAVVLVVASASALADPGEWVFTSETDEMSGETEHRVRSESLREVVGGNGFSRPILEFSCSGKRKNRMALYTSFPLEVKYTSNDILQQMGNESLLWDVQIQYKLDDKRPRSETWLPGENAANSSTTIAYRYNVVGYAKRFRKAETALFRVWTLIDGQQTFDFDLTGLDDALHQLGEACGAPKLMRRKR